MFLSSPQAQQASTVCTSGECEGLRDLCCKVTREPFTQGGRYGNRAASQWGHGLCGAVSMVFVNENLKRDDESGGVCQQVVLTLKILFQNNCHCHV